MTNQEWPDWRSVAAGVQVEGAHVCAWPLPSHSKPMLALHQRNEPRRLIRIEFGPNTGSVAGYQCFKGTNYLLVYESELPAIRAKVPNEKDKALFAVAEETYERELAKFIAERTRDGRGPSREEALREFFRTPWNIYYEISGRKTGYPKVHALDIHPDPVPPPETAASVAQNAADRNAEAIGRAIATALAEQKMKQKAANG